jgi:hypothetical protein
MKNYEDNKYEMRRKWEEQLKQMENENNAILEGCSGGVCSIGSSQNEQKNTSMLVGGLKATNKPINVKAGDIVLREEDGGLKQYVITSTFSKFNESYCTGVHAEKSLKSDFLHEEISFPSKSIVVLLGSVSTLNESYKTLDANGKNLEESTQEDDTQESIDYTIHYYDRSKRIINIKQSDIESNSHIILDGLKNGTILSISGPEKGLEEECGAGTFGGAIAFHRAPIGENKKPARRWKKREKNNIIYK